MRLSFIRGGGLQTTSVWTSFGYMEISLVGETVIRHHPIEACTPNVCCIHNPSNHPLIHAPQHWRSDRGIMERICSHGIGHPDPDGLILDSTHGCDGCCVGLPLFSD